MTAERNSSGACAARLESCGTGLYRLRAGTGNGVCVSYLAGRAPAGTPVDAIPHLHPAPSGIVAHDGLAVRLTIQHEQHFYGLGEGGQALDPGAHLVGYFECRSAHGCHSVLGLGLVLRR